jgi:hypothetical protein
MDNIIQNGDELDNFIRNEAQMDNIIQNGADLDNIIRQSLFSDNDWWVNSGLRIFALERTTDHSLAPVPCVVSRCM